MGVLNPNVYSTLLRDRDEEIQDVVTKHAAAYWVSFAEVLAALAMGVLVAIVPATLSMVPFTIASAVAISVLDGTQSVSTAEPPMPSESTTVTRAWS